MDFTVAFDHDRITTGQLIVLSIPDGDERCHPAVRLRIGLFYFKRRPLDSGILPAGGRRVEAFLRKVERVIRNSV